MVTFIYRVGAAYLLVYIYFYIIQYLHDAVIKPFLFTLLKNSPSCYFYYVTVEHVGELESCSRIN